MASTAAAQEAPVLVVVNEGLGNQLFNYAFGRAVAISNGTYLVLDHRSQYAVNRFGRHYLLSEFAIDASLASHRASALGAAALLWWKAPWVFPGRAKLGTLVREKMRALDLSAIDMPKRGGRVFAGYWQHEAYFKGIARDLRRELKPKASFDGDLRAFGDMLATVNSVCVHVRSFSEIGGGPDLRDYYERAVGVILETEPDSQFFVFSDDHVRARAVLPGNVEWRHVMVSSPRVDTSVSDLWLMTMCRHHVMSRSTLAWWGAWLSTRHGLGVSPSGAPQIGCATPHKQWRSLSERQGSTS